MKVDLMQAFREINKYEFQTRVPNKSTQAEHPLFASDISV